MDEAGETFIQRCRNCRVGRIEREFRFDSQALHYRISDNTGERTVAILYENIGIRKSKILTFKNRIYRTRIFLVFFLTLIAFFCLVAAFSQFLPPIVFPCLSAAAILVGIYLFWRTTGEYTHTVLESGEGKVHILHDHQHDEIVGNLRGRWRDRLRELYGEINPLHSPAQELQKFESLYKSDVISEQEYHAAREQLLRRQEEQLERSLPGERKPN